MNTDTHFLKNAADDYTLKNVRLETGFITDEDGIIGTQTDLFCIAIHDGKIKNIYPNSDAAADAIDCKGLLLLPAFKDMHVHIDKTLYGLPWKALAPKPRKVTDMIAYEQAIIPSLLETSTKRAEMLIDLLQKQGTTFARTHFNVDSTSGLRSLANLQKALDHKKERFQAELVAFPQHGLYYTDSAALMKEACQLESVGFVGGLDPFSIDKNIEKAIDFTVQLALDNNKGIDIHLHDVGKEGLRTIEYLMEQTLQNPQLQGKTFVSHAFVLADLDPQNTEAIAEKLAAAKVGIVSAIPFQQGKAMPIPILAKYAVEVLVGNDNIQDYWSVLGTGNMLQKANLMAGLYGWETEFDLSRTLGYATRNILPLDDQGAMQWPKVGDAADLLFIDAPSSAAAVARMPKPAAFTHAGTMYGL